MLLLYGASGVFIIWKNRRCLALSLMQSNLLNFGCVLVFCWFFGSNRVRRSFEEFLEQTTLTIIFSMNINWIYSFQSFWLYYYHQSECDLYSKHWLPILLFDYKQNLFLYCLWIRRQDFLVSINFTRKKIRQS